MLPQQEIVPAPASIGESWACRARLTAVMLVGIALPPVTASPAQAALHLGDHCRHEQKPIPGRLGRVGQG